MKTFFLFLGDRPPFNLQFWDMFARLTAMFGILNKCDFTEPLTLLREVIFDEVNVMKTFYDRLWTCNLGIYSLDWQLCSEFTAEFFTNVTLRNLCPCFVEPTLRITGLYS